MREISRTKGSKNKKTLLKESVIEKIDGNLLYVTTNSINGYDELKQRIALRLFTLEKKVHDDFIKYISHFGNIKLYESYIINEIMIKYVNGKIGLLKIDMYKMHDYMLAYGHVGFEQNGKESDEFKSANKLIHKKINSFVQYQYPIIVDPDLKTSMMAKGFSTSYVINELLKLYIIGDIKIDLQEIRIKEWENRYNYVIKNNKYKMIITTL